MRDENRGACARARDGVAHARAADTDEHSVEEAALATDDYATQGPGLWGQQGDLFAAQPAYPPQEQAIIDRALEILEARLRKSKGPIMQSPEDIVDYLRLHLADKPAERFLVLYLTSRHALIEMRVEATGTVDGAAVYPREIIRSVIELNAAAIVCAHQHPSQNPSPSEADRELTLKLGRALAPIDVRLIDHIVVGGMEHVSMAELGWI